MIKINYMSTLFVGIDVSSKSNVVYSMDFDENKIKHGDLKKLCFGRILTIIFWFYPITYLFYHDVELVCETACDQRVLLQMGGKAVYNKYFSLILSHAQPPKKIPTCFGLNNKLQLKYRMKASRLFDYHKTPSSFCTMLVGIIFLFGSSIAAQASLPSIRQINYDWYDATTKSIEMPYEAPVYTFCVEEETPGYMESTFFPDQLKCEVIDARRAHGINSYAFTLAPGERKTITYIYLTPENIMTIAGAYLPTNASLKIGISNGNYSQCIYPSGGGFSPAFSISSAGIYQLFIENTGTVNLTLKGSYSF